MGMATRAINGTVCWALPARAMPSREKPCSRVNKQTEDDTTRGQRDVNPAVHPLVTVRNELNTCKQLVHFDDGNE